MKGNYIFIFFLSMLLTSAATSFAQAPPILWQKTIGGDDSDIMSSMYALNGGGLVVSGYSKSGISGDKKDSSRGGYDFWAMKLEADGRLSWEKLTAVPPTIQLHASSERKTMASCWQAPACPHAPAIRHI